MKNLSAEVLAKITGILKFIKTYFNQVIRIETCDNATKGKY